MKLKTISKSKWILIAFPGFLLLCFWFCLPDPLFEEPYSTVLDDKNGNLLGAQIANDGQWRFPECDSVPVKLKTAMLNFEDEYFYNHPGINPVSLFRAARQNLAAGKIVSGGSTISMQVIRLSRKGQGRTFFEKILEMFLCLRLEFSYTKEEILSLYSSHAPYGGNVVGLQAASWRYYGRPAHLLSWGEAAALAVLPNAPALVYPGKNHALLLKKRNRLLDKLLSKGRIDSLTCELAKEEVLPEKPRSIPQVAPHLLTRMVKEGKRGQKIATTVDIKLQERANQIVEKYHRALMQNQIDNAAVLITEVETGNILAYIGNTSTEGKDAGGYVDIITAPRSTGSIMKPFLYALMLSDGEILPNTLVSDIPTRISGYAPKNFYDTYDGAVPAGNALARSLNVPAVKMLQSYGVDRFYDKLKKLGISTINRPADHYGLSLILGGAEASLWDLSSIYTSMARVLVHFQHNSSMYNETDWRKINFYKDYKEPPEKLSSSGILSAGAIWQTFETLSDVRRPREEEGWEAFFSSKRIAWKTGTSFGHRDAWAIGITPDFTVGIWVGNADGEGRPGLTGVQVAAPVLFDIFKILPSTQWFDIPYDDLLKASVCSKSGCIASMICEPVDTIFIVPNGLKTNTCPYHQVIHLDKSEQFRVTSDCYSIAEMVEKSWFILPPVQEWYYKSKAPGYQSLPPFAIGCMDQEYRNMGLIYPRETSKIFIPRELDGSPGKAIFEAAHRRPEAEIHWHIDEVFITTTKGQHSIEVRPEEGMHTLTLIDEQGETLKKRFEALER